MGVVLHHPLYSLSFSSHGLSLSFSAITLLSSSADILPYLYPLDPFSFCLFLFSFLLLFLFFPTFFLPPTHSSKLSSRALFLLRFIRFVVSFARSFVPELFFFPSLLFFFLAFSPYPSFFFFPRPHRLSRPLFSRRWPRSQADSAGTMPLPLAAKGKNDRPRLLS